MNFHIVSYPVSSVVIGAKRRALNRDKVQQLAQSIQQLGLLNPLTITTEGLLVAGLHRLEACKTLGWEEVPASIVTLDALCAELAEIDENLIRNELNELEQGLQLARRKEIYLVMHPETKATMGNSVARRLNDTVSFSRDSSDKTGQSQRTIERKVQIGEALQDIAPRLMGTSIADSQKDLLALSRMDNGGRERVLERLEAGGALNVKDAIRKTRLDEQVAAIEAFPAPKGKFRVIVADPPWRYTKRAEDVTHRGACPYPTMDIPSICALSVEELAHDDCVLWLWTTNAFMEEAYQVARAWGFEVKTILTWAKDRMGVGDWLRGQTEHCLMAIRGKPVVVLTNQTTLLNGPLRDHSRKPEEFYTLVDALCPGNKCELFAREKRPGWESFGAEIGALDD